METITLQATPRETRGRKNYQLRSEGLIPAIVYGTKAEPTMVTLDRNAFVHAFNEGGESTVIELVIEGGETLNVLVQDMQLDPLRDEVIHADFRIVDLSKPVDAEVKLEFVGESPAVKNLGGSLMQALESVEVRALPKNLVSEIEVSLEKLATFDDVIRVSDLQVPEGVEFLTDVEETVAIVTPPRSEEEMAELDEAVEENVESVEVVKEEKEESEEGEGAKEASSEDKN